MGDFRYFEDYLRERLKAENELLIEYLKAAIEIYEQDGDKQGLIFALYSAIDGLAEDEPLEP